MINRLLIMLRGCVFCLGLFLLASCAGSRLTTAERDYIYAAYVQKTTNLSIRGYPAVDPPAGFSGNWRHIKWNGDLLAEIGYLGGKRHGLSYWYDDAGEQYLIREFSQGRAVRDYFRRDLPISKPDIPRHFVQKYLNPSVKIWRKNPQHARPSP